MSMTQCKKDVTPVLTHWSYVFLALTHQCLFCIKPSIQSGGRLNIKMPSYQYRDSHVKDKTVSPTVLSLTWESPYLGKMVFILRRGPGLIIVQSVNSLSLGRCGCDFNKSGNFKHNLGVVILSIQMNITLEWMTEDLIYSNSTWLR